ncbi:MAG: HD domain-containing protein [Actinomycetota bacterium]
MVDRDAALAIAAEHGDELASRLAFVYELDKLKTVLRQSMLIDDSRQENSAEHSWHLAMTAMTLAPLADEVIDVSRAIKILLVHDIVEIDAGDVFIYDDAQRAAAEAAEQAAAERIFGLLPAEQAAEFRGLWDEYEERSTPEGRFAYACDRLQPLLLNVAIGGGSWRRHGVTADRVKAINGAIDDGLSQVWAVAERFIDQAVADGQLLPPAE